MPYFHRIRQEEHEMILELRNQGVPLADIAAKLNVHKGTIAKHVSRGYTLTRYAKGFKEDREDFRDTVQVAYECQVIYKMRNQSDTAIRQRLKISKTRLIKLKSRLAARKCFIRPLDLAFPPEPDLEGVEQAETTPSA